MAFEYGKQRDENGNIIREGPWGEDPRDDIEQIIENFRALMEDDIVAAGHLGGKTLEEIYVDINSNLNISEVVSSATAD